MQYFTFALSSPKGNLENGGESEVLKVSALSVTESASLNFSAIVFSFFSASQSCADVVTSHRIHFSMNKLHIDVRRHPAYRSSLAQQYPRVEWSTWGSS